MARPAKSLLKDSHPELAKQVVDKSLLDTLSTGSESKIEWECELGHRWEAKVYNRTNAKNHTGCPYCNHRKLLVGFNDLATTHPDVAKLCYNPEDAYKIMATSAGKRKWKCEKGHVWEAPASRLTFQGSRCPYCSGRLVIPGKSDLLTLYPNIAKELADQSLVSKLRPGSPKKVEWICSNDSSHRWFAIVYDRTGKGNGCPYCSGRNIIEGKTDFATLYPDLVQYMVKPEMAKKIGKSSEVSVEWICEKYPDHRWFATPRNRISGGCPICAGKQVLVGFNDLATTNPELVDELVDKSLATKITRGSGKKVEWICSKGHRWFISPFHRTGLNPTGCPVCNPTGTSNREKDLADVVRILVGEDIITNDKLILPNRMELDIVVPSKKIAIEFNGVRWHSDLSGKGNDYHLNKLKMCKSAGYRLIHVWEDDWDERRDIVIKMLAYKLGCIDRLKSVLSDIDDKVCKHVYARKLRFGVADSDEAKQFLNENHIQGYVTATMHLGLWDDDGDLRALLSIRSPRNNARMSRKEGEWEIQRYATLGVVPGGFTKLVKYAENYLKALDENITTWISFAAYDVSDGGLYEKSGFVVDKILPPDYKYVGDFTHWKRVPKERFQKKDFQQNPKLKWQDGWTETVAARENGLYRIYDAGKVRYVKYVS